MVNIEAFYKKYRHFSETQQGSFCHYGITLWTEQHIHREKGNDLKTAEKGRGHTMSIQPIFGGFLTHHLGF